MGLLYNPRGIFFDRLVLWAQDGHATRPTTLREVSARKPEHLF